MPLDSVNFLNNLEPWIRFYSYFLIAFFLLGLLALGFGSLRTRRRLASARRGLSDLSPADPINGANEETHRALASVIETLPDGGGAWWAAIQPTMAQYARHDPIKGPQVGYFVTEPVEESVVGAPGGADGWLTFAHAVPGVLTSLGLLGTFVALLMGLSGLQKNLDGTWAIDPLVSNLSGKFVTSIVALALSVVFVLLELATRHAVTRARHRLALALSRVMPFLSTSHLLLDMQQENVRRSVVLNEQSSVLKALHTVGERQVTQLERFNTDLADQYVTTSTIASAGSFTIRPLVDSAGAIDFDVQPVRDPGTQDETFRPALPQAREMEWNKYFRKLPLRTCYPAGAGHYVVVTPGLRDALSVAKRMTTASPGQKREFVRNPRPFLREALPAMTDDAIEQVFWECADYSERVREIGLWQPRVLPFLKKSGIEWLPDEPMGLTVGGTQVDVRPEHAQEIVDKLEQAQAAGQTWIQHEGQRIPVTDEAIASARELAEIARTYGLDTPQSPKPPTPDDTPGVSGRLVLLIKDNLEDDGFERTWKPRAGDVVSEAPAPLSTPLLDFQKDGYRWLQELWTKGAPGALLADDMGLGKTLQTLAFLVWLRQHQRAKGMSSRPILTVAPTGLLKNWLAEHDKHLQEPGLGEILQLHGQGLADLRTSPRIAPELSIGFSTLDTARIRAADWVLTTYETLRDYQHSFGAINWDVLVLDEAQKIKNPQALLTVAAKAVNADFTVAVTGTPVENRLADLWSIVDTLEPGRLGTLKAFVTTYEPDGGVDPEVLGRLKRRLVSPDPPVLQRRTKTSATWIASFRSTHLLRSRVFCSDLEGQDVAREPFEIICS